MGNTTKKAFPVLNMHCAGCANNVERTVKKLPGVIEASVNFATNTLTVSYEKEQLTPGEIRAAVLAAGYDPVSYTHLDVYKRQVLRQSSTHPLCLLLPIIRILSA